LPDVLITGRTSDVALFLAPLVHAFGWAADDWPLLAAGSVVGHLLECAGQLTGGYFDDERRKQVPGLARRGFPYAEVTVPMAVRSSPNFPIQVAGSIGRPASNNCSMRLRILPATSPPMSLSIFARCRWCRSGADQRRTGLPGPRNPKG
jgi:hypothetical protein